LNFNIKTIYNKHNILAKLLDYKDVSIDDINLNFLSDYDIDTFHSFKSEKRKLEFYHLRILWDSFNTNNTILYKPSGKPFLKEGFLSMTHSHKKVVIAYSLKQEVGVDIEMISDKIEKVKHKFLHPNDNYNTLKDLTQLWTIKEAVYKLFDGDNLFFMDNIEVKNLSNQIAEINHNGICLSSKFDSLFINDKFIISIAVTNFLKSSLLFQ
jgi:phosphopantetheinyl transferase (holo-ACP synthase)